MESVYRHVGPQADPAKWDATERAAVLAVALHDAPDGLTVAEAADLVGLGKHGARKMIEGISRRLPLWEDTSGGVIRFRYLRDSDFRGPE